MNSAFKLSKKSQHNECNALDLAHVGEHLDRLPIRGLHVLAVMICGVGLFADVAEVALSNALAAVFMASPYSMSKQDLAWLLASVFAGAALGAPTLGWLADRFGRRSILQTALVVIAGGAAGAAMSASVGSLSAFRFLSGFAIGAYPPLTTAYLAEILPKARRGSLIMVCGGLAFLGAPVAILSVRSLAPDAFGIEAWRFGVAGGGVVAAVAAALYFLLPESPRWLATRGRREEALRACRRLGVGRDGLAGASSAASPDPAPASDSARHRSLLLVLIYVLAPWATLGFPLLSAASLISKGLSLETSLFVGGVSMVGPSIGILGIAFFADRLDRRATLICCAGGMAVLAIGFVSAESIPVILLVGVAFNLASAIFSAVLFLYGAEIFPTRSRAALTATAFAAGRLISIFVPPTLLYLLADYGRTFMFAAIAAAIALAAAILVFAGPPGEPRSAIH